MHRNISTAWIAALLAGLCASAHAASPNLGNILPRGGARGTEVEVRFLGGNLADSVDLLFADPGIALKEVVSAAGGEFKCILSIAPDCRLGRHPIRVRTSSGLSNLQIFSVGALREIVETEPNNDPAGAQVVSLGTTINGVTENEDVDYYAVELEAGAKLAAEIEAIRLGHTLFDAKMKLFSPDGHELISEDDTAAMRQDPAFVYIAETAGRYVVAVSEAAYGGNGNCEYRLHLGQFPRPLAVTPLGGAPEAPVQVSWLGDSRMAGGEIVLAALAPGTRTIEPSNETGFAPTPLAFRVSTLPGTLEQEPNNAPDQATGGVAPGAFDGVIAEHGDVDWFAFDGTKDQSYEIRVWARELGSPLDSVLTVNGPDGAQLASVDDVVGPDSLARVKLPADGRYTFSVRDHLGHGGATFAYRVEAAPSSQALSFSAANNEIGVLPVARSNRAFQLFNISRAGFDGPLELEFRNLPAGVSVEHGPIAAGQGELPVIFSAAADAAPAGALVDVHGIWRNGDAVLEGGLSQTYRLVLGQNQTVFDSEEIDALAMAVTEEAPYSIEIVAPKTPMPINSLRYLRVVATRKEGFTAPIDLSAPWLPKGCGVPVTKIEEGQTEATIRLEVRGDAPRGEFPLVINGASGGYVVCTPFTPVSVEEPWLAMEIPETQGELGQPIAWQGKLSVAKAFEGEFAMEIVGMPKGITCEAQKFSAGTTDIAFPVQVAADAPEGKHGPLGFRTTMTIDGEDITLSLAGPQMKIFKPLPPELKQPAPAPQPADNGEPAQQEAPKRKTRFPNAN